MFKIIRKEKLKELKERLIDSESLLNSTIRELKASKDNERMLSMELDRTVSMKVECNVEFSKEIPFYVRQRVDQDRRSYVIETIPMFSITYSEPFAEYDRDWETP